MEKIPCFIGAVIGGCLVMHVTGVQILISLLSSAPLAKRRHRKNPGFDLKKANRRILRISLIGFVLLLLVSAIVMRFVSVISTMGYLIGLILSLVCSIRRMTPNNRKNQRSFEHIYADCYPFVPKAPQAPAETAAEQIEAPAEQPGPEEAQPENGGGEL